MVTKQKAIEAIKAIPEDEFTHIDVVIKELISLEEKEKELDKMRNKKTTANNDLLDNEQ